MFPLDIFETSFGPTYRGPHGVSVLVRTIKAVSRADERIATLTDSVVVMIKMPAANRKSNPIAS